MYFTLASELMPLIENGSMCSHAAALRRTVHLSLAAAGLAGVTALATGVILLAAHGVVESDGASNAVRSIVLAEHVSALIVWALLLLAAHQAGGAIGTDCSRRPRAALLIITSLSAFAAFVVLVRPMLQSALGADTTGCGRTADALSWVIPSLHLAALIAALALALQINRWFNGHLLAVRRVVVLAGVAGATFAAPLVSCVAASEMMRSAAVVSVGAAATTLWCAWASIELVRIRSRISAIAHDRDERVVSIDAKTPTDSNPWASRV